MDKLLQNSLLWRLLQRLGSHCCRSLTAGLLHALWNSPPIRWLRGLLAGPPLVESSALGRGMDACAGGLHRLGRRLSPLLSGSLPVRGGRWLGGQLRSSRLLGWLFAGGATGLLLTVLGLFGAVDWLLRDVLAVQGLASYWDEALLLLGLLLVLRRQMTVPCNGGANAMTLPLFQFFAVCLTLFVLTAGRWPQIAVPGLRATCQGILWFPLLVRLLRGKRDLRRIYACMVLAAFVISLHAIWQYIAAVPIPANWIDAAEQNVRTRAFSIFGSPNILGDFLVLFAPMTFALVYTAKRRVWKFLFFFMGLCMLVACLFTLSRGAWGGLLVAAFVFALLADRRLLILLFGGLLLALALPFVADRLLYLFSASYAHAASLGGRALRWQTTLGYLKESGSLWLGLGFGRFGGAVAMQNQVEPNWQYFYVDNYYVKLLAENGILGLASFLLLQLGLLFAGLKSWRRVRHTRLRGLAAGMLSGIAGVLVHCYFENIFEEPYMLVYYWVVAAMLVYLGRVESGKWKVESG